MVENPLIKHKEMRRKLVMGTLLHDIGKLVQRSDEKPTSMTHADFGARWLEERETLREFADFAKYHHSPREYGEAFLLCLAHLADWLAAGERLDIAHEKGVWESDIILLSLFSKITREGNQSRVEPRSTGWEGRYYELVPASELIFPKKLDEIKKTGTAENYRAILNGLEKDLEVLGENVSINSILFLLEKYLSYVPSHTRRARNDPRLDPDISLFDHCKLAAAVSLCLFLYCSDLWGEDVSKWEPEKLDLILAGLGEEGSGGNATGLKDEAAFLLVDINLSGIQNFIYNISTKRAARSLRARSFYLEMLCEDLAQEALERCGLERTNLLFSGGGRARVLAPNLDGVKAALRDVEREANDFLSRLGGGLSVNLSWVELRGTDMVISTDARSPLSEILKKLGEEAESRKHTRAAEALTQGMAIGPFEPLSDECRICHVETEEPVELAGEEGEEPLPVCPTCRMLINLGGDLRRLPRCIYIQRKEAEAEAPAEHLDLPFGRLSWKEKPENLRIALVLRDRWEASSYQGPEFVGFAYPAYGHPAGTFQELAKESVGEARLGVLRMDVDDLGSIFAEGIAESEMSFTRYSVLSRMLNRYFREYLPAVISGEAEGAGSLPLFERPPEKKRAAEIIYSGGDDLFVVGAWNDLLEAAFDISACFKKYACENPALHISGGLVVHAHDHPLYRLARLSEEEEGRAKSVEGKSAFCLFERKAGWDKYGRAFREVLLPLLALREGELPTLKSMGQEPEGETKARYYLEIPIPKALLRRLMRLYRDGSGPNGKLNLPILCYVLARAKERLEKGERWAERKPVWDKLEATLKEYLDLETTFAALCCADLLSRGG